MVSTPLIVDDQVQILAVDLVVVAVDQAVHLMVVKVVLMDMMVEMHITLKTAVVEAVEHHPLE